MDGWMVGRLLEKVEGRIVVDEGSRKEVRMAVGEGRRMAVGE